MDIPFSLVLATAGLIVTGLAAVLGIWVGWDEKKPPRYAWALSILVVLSTLVGLGNAYEQNRDTEQIEGDLARVLDELDEVAQRSDDPAVSDLLAREMAMTERARPSVMLQLKTRAALRGRTPEQMRERFAHVKPPAPTTAAPTTSDPANTEPPSVPEEQMAAPTEPTAPSSTTTTARKVPIAAEHLHRKGATPKDPR